MRIDDFNRSVPAQQTDKTGAISPGNTGKLNEASSEAADPDAADISPLAAHALDPSLGAAAAQARQARIEQLRLQVQRGEYNVSAEEVAGSIIDQHKTG